MPSVRRLIVMRHAKSSWKTDAQTDHERPLNKRGRRDAPRIAEELAGAGWGPELVWSSDSTRTRETWALAAPQLDPDVSVTFTEALYHAGIGAVQACAERWDDEVSTAMVLGHNPGWEDMVSRLSGQRVTMTTANAALLVGAGASWAEALERPWTLEAMLRPRELTQ